MATATALMAALSGDYVVTAPPSSSMNVAGLVIDPGDSTPSTACVEFNQDTISGLDLLDESGFAYDSQDGFMNSILGVSNAEGETNYWSYWQWNGREWQFKNVGAGESAVLPGSIEGWHFTSWEVFPSLPPDFVPNLDEICEGDTLKNYTVQPYLNYEDLPSTISQDTREAEANGDETVEEPSPTSMPEQSATETRPSSSFNEPAEAITTDQPERSLLPIFIIAGIGIVLVIMAILVLQKTRQ